MARAMFEYTKTVLEKVSFNAELFRKGMQDIGYETGTSQTPIIPVIIGHELKTFRLWKKLLKKD